MSDAAPLAGLRNLRSLDLSGTQITDVAPLAALSGLQYLDLTRTPVSNLSALAHLSGCQIVTAPRAARYRRRASKACCTLSALAKSTPW